MKESIQRVAVVGAGTMGLGIALVSATSGFDTLLFDVRHEQVDNALRQIEKNLSQAIGKGKLTENHGKETLSRIKPVNHLSDLKVDLVIEAAAERLEVKQQLFQELEQINNGKAILATNTSSISVTQIARVLKDPSRCIGLHFFNPADRMKLVEIISGDATDPKWVILMKEVSQQMGKTPVLAKDSPGFIVNRVARHFYLESLKLLEENVAPVPTVDTLFRSAGFRMGPFELMDLIGVDTNLAVTTSVYEGFGKASKFKPSVLQRQLVEAGHFGRKTGKGFYEYPTK